MDMFHVFLGFAIILGIIAGIVSIIAGMSMMSGAGPGRGIGLLAAILGLIGGPFRDRAGGLHSGGSGSREHQEPGNHQILGLVLAIRS